MKPLEQGINAMYSGPITIYQRQGYKLDSYGNGAAYALTRLSDNASVFFQGDDAESFREEFDKAFVFNDACMLNMFEQYSDVMEVHNEA